MGGAWFRPKPSDGTFTAVDAKSTSLPLLATMRAGPRYGAQRDKNCWNAVVQIREARAYNLRPPFPWLQVGGVLVGVLGLWGVLGLVRRRLRDLRRGRSEPGRLVLVGALLGGMFGTAAGHWIYDSLFVAASRSAAPLEPAMARIARWRSLSNRRRQRSRIDLTLRYATSQWMNRIRPPRARFGKAMNDP